jgi:beta-glucosidase
MTDETSDFVGINHYFHNLVDGAFLENTDARKSDMGWGLNPEALYHVLMQAAAFKKPIIVTENGLADAKDAQRAWFLQESIAQMMRAKKDGADVRGYLHWSLLDNFEWDKGYWPQFGLIAVDRTTMRRTPRGSARTYAEIIQRFDSGFPPSRE